MSESFESMQWDALCAVTRPPYSHPREFRGNGVRIIELYGQNPFYLQGKNPLYRRLRGRSNTRRCTTQNHEPNTLPTEQFWPPKEFWGNGVRTHANSKGKIPSTRKILLRGGSSRNVGTIPFRKKNTSACLSTTSRSRKMHSYCRRQHHLEHTAQPRNPTVTQLCCLLHALSLSSCWMIRFFLF